MVDQLHAAISLFHTLSRLLARPFDFSRYKKDDGKDEVLFGRETHLLLAEFLKGHT